MPTTNAVNSIVQKKGDFFSSIGDLFTNDIPAGFKVVTSDIVHLGSVVGSAILAPAAAFAVANVLPALEKLIIHDVSGGIALTPAGIVTGLVSSGLAALWTIASKSPSNSIGAIVAAIPQSEVQTIETKISAAAGQIVQKAIAPTPRATIAPGPRAAIQPKVFVPPVAVPTSPAPAPETIPPGSTHSADVIPEVKS